MEAGDLVWLGREDIAAKEKKQFIEKLINFDDGCGKWSFKKIDRGFYSYHAYFLATPRIIEFNTRSLLDVIVGQLVKWGSENLIFPI